MVWYSSSMPSEKDGRMRSPGERALRNCKARPGTAISSQLSAVSKKNPSRKASQKKRKR
jgi:hypothetical protein